MRVDVEVDITIGHLEAVEQLLCEDMGNARGFVGICLLVSSCDGKWEITHVRTDVESVVTPDLVGDEPPRHLCRLDIVGGSYLWQREQL